MRQTRLTRSILPLALACALRSGTTVHAAEPDPQEAAIAKTAEAFVEAFQKGDAKASSGLATAKRANAKENFRVFNWVPVTEY
jgi:hypothetical protein